MDKIKFVWSKTNRWHIGILIFLVVELRLFPGGKVGFTCNDPALSHPFTGDTITWKQLFLTVLLAPLAVMLITERVYHNDKYSKPRRRALYWYREYLFGVLVNLVTVQTLKLIVGSPRPHFFDTCSPKEAVTCEGSEYISQYTCTKSHWISTSDKSFPSGHTSLAVHAGLFLIYYLHSRATKSRGVLVLQCLLMALAIFCAISRMTDHRHHWWDVLAGVIIGIPILIYTCYSLCNNFKCRKQKTTHNGIKETEIQQQSGNGIESKDK